MTQILNFAVSLFSLGAALFVLDLWYLAQESQREMSLPLGSLFACARRCCKQDTQTCAEQSLYLVVSTSCPAEHRELPTPTEHPDPLLLHSHHLRGRAGPGHILHADEFSYFTSFFAS